MALSNDHQPASYKGVMISSTFRDLQQHRKALFDALNKQELHPIGMELDVPLAGADILSSSLAMVGKGSAYIGLISHRYGQVISDPKRNPANLSVTELEYHEAQRLGIPTLIFIMGNDHPVKVGDVEKDAERMEKLAAFRETAKAGRLYMEFNSEEEFARESIHIIAKLSQQLNQETAKEEPQARGFAGMANVSNSPSIPAPPTLYAEPPYIGSHQFVGRTSQLETLDDWAKPADVHPVLLFEAIGGTGKSMLTWHWVNHHATSIRSDWAGIFWYSFYEKGAVMADFCRRALAYMTHQPYENFKKKKTLELSQLLIQQLQQRPWLIICDGLERVLVAYHRIDAARVLDEEAGTRDVIADRDPCAAIRPEDDDLLRMMAGAAPSKLLLTSRLTPKTLLNASNQHLPGVRAELLPGLRPKDAETLFRACDVTGDSDKIQDFLQRHCDCHPLVTGVLAGLVINYFPDRGNFDAWAADPEGGVKLNLAELDLVQKRNHIIRAALSDLDVKGLELLSTLSLLSQSADYQLLRAVNPHFSEDQANRKLEETVKLLEKSGLLQYDFQSKHYDLHPVVRGVVAGKLEQEELNKYGQKVVDHFSQQSHGPYEEAETLEDLEVGLNLMKTLLAMGRYEEAFEIYQGELTNPLFHNLNAWGEILNIISPFFVEGLNRFPSVLNNEYAQDFLMNDLSYVLDSLGEYKRSVLAMNMNIAVSIKIELSAGIVSSLRNISVLFWGKDDFYKFSTCLKFAFLINDLLDDDSEQFINEYYLLNEKLTFGEEDHFITLFQKQSYNQNEIPKDSFLKVALKYTYAKYLFQRNELTIEQLKEVEKISRADRDRQTQTKIISIKGAWHLKNQRYPQASEAFQEVITREHQVGVKDIDSAINLALANHHLGRLTHPLQTAENLTRQKEDSLNLAKLWHALGEKGKATKCALAAYKTAWADGEPYVHRYNLNEAIAFLQELAVPIPELPPFDPSTVEKFPWEDDLLAYIERLKAEKAAEEE